jgi:hypothetical protein
MSAIESADVRRARHGRPRGTAAGAVQGAVAGPVFVDASGRRARLLRRLGLLVGAVCVGYAGVLGLAFMGWGTSLAPSSLLSFGDGQAAGATGPGGPGGGAAAGGRGSSPSADASVTASPSTTVTAPASAG